MNGTSAGSVDPVGQLLSKLPSSKPSGSRWMARCPAHDDSTRSLQIARGDDGRALLKCFAGCSLERILTALGLPVSALFASDKSQPEPDVIYTYQDEGGSVAYQIVRKANKQFKQRHPNGGGEWVWNMEGVKRLPYRLPELMAADPAVMVFIVEGEKDADRLMMHKLIATTNSGGAGHWSPTLTPYFKGRHVAILPDNDEPGRRHAEAVAETLWGVAASVTIVQLAGVPDKGDVSDWLAAGHTARELAQLVVETPEWHPGAGDEGGALVRIWEQNEPAPRQFAVAGIVPDSAVTLFYGDGGQGKSYVALGMAMLSCMGQPFLGRFVEKRTALYIDAELDSTEFIRRSYKLARGLGHDRPPEGLHYYQLSGSLSDPAVQGRVEKARQECNAQFVIFDSLSIGSFSIDASDAGAVIGVLKFLESFRCPVIVIDHIAKPLPGVNLSQYRAFGTVFKGNVARSAIQVIKAEGGALTLLHKKSNFSALSDPIHLIVEFDTDDDSVRLTQISAGDERLAGIEDNLPAAEQVLRELAKYDTGARPEFLSTELGKSLSTIKNHLAALHKQHRAYPVGDGTWRAG